MTQVYTSRNVVHHFKAEVQMKLSVREGCLTVNQQARVCLNTPVPLKKSKKNRQDFFFSLTFLESLALVFVSTKETIL